MHFEIYAIRSKILQSHIKYVLFNQSKNVLDRSRVISYANNNICLGVIKGHSLVRTKDACLVPKSCGSIYSYISGMYLPSHVFESRGLLDEICIDFSPMGYYHFSRVPVHTYLLDGDPCSDIFGSDAKDFFEKVFEEGDLQKRGMKIEAFLLHKKQHFEDSFLAEVLHNIHSNLGNVTLRSISTDLRCSENKILRRFKNSFSVTPKEYIRIVRFRRALRCLHELRGTSLTDIAYLCGYYDQSHFIREMKFFTKSSPGRLRQNLTNVDHEVLVSVQT